MTTSLRTRSLSAIFSSASPRAIVSRILARSPCRTRERSAASRFASRRAAVTALLGVLAVRLRVEPEPEAAGVRGVPRPRVPPPPRRTGVSSACSDSPGGSSPPSSWLAG